MLQTPSVAPVAVLVDGSTASSAEAITIAFHGRPSTRSFGSRTAGKSTAVQPFKLDDGAELYLTTAIDADRSGKPYPNGFTPDQVVSFNGGSMPQESNDQALLAAQTWLVASTTSVAPQAPAVLKTKTRSKRASVHTKLASIPPPAPQPTNAPAVAAVQTPISAPAPAAVEVPAAAPAAVAAAPVPAAVAPVSAPAATVVPEAPAATVAQAPAAPTAPAPAAAVAQTPNSADVVTPIQAIATPPAQTSAPAAAVAGPPQMVASTTPATPPPPPAPKPKPHKKVVVHEGS